MAIFLFALLALTMGTATFSGVASDVRPAIAAWVLTSFMFGLGQNILTWWANGLATHPFHLFPVQMKEVFDFFMKKTLRRAAHILWLTLLLGIWVAVDYQPPWLPLALTLLICPILAIAVALLCLRWVRWPFLYWGFFMAGIVGVQTKSPSLRHFFLEFTPGGLLIKPLTGVAPAGPLLCLLGGVTLLAALAALPIYRRMRSSYLRLEATPVSDHTEEAIDLVARKITVENEFSTREAEVRETMERAEFLETPALAPFDRWMRQRLPLSDSRLLTHFCPPDFFTRALHRAGRFAGFAALLGVVAAWAGEAWFNIWVTGAGLAQVLRGVMPATSFFSTVAVGSRHAPLAAMFPVPPVRAMWLGLFLKRRLLALNAVVCSPVLFAGLLFFGIGLPHALAGTALAIVLNLLVGVAIDASKPWMNVKPRFNPQGFAIVLAVGFLVILYLIALLAAGGLVVAIVTQESITNPDSVPFPFLLVILFIILPPAFHLLLTTHWVGRMWWDLLYLPPKDSPPEV